MHENDFFIGGPNISKYCFNQVVEANPGILAASSRCYTVLVHKELILLTSTPNYNKTTSRNVRAPNSSQAINVNAVPQSLLFLVLMCSADFTKRATAGLEHLRDAYVQLLPVALCVGLGWLVQKQFRPLPATAHILGSPPVLFPRGGMHGVVQLPTISPFHPDALDVFVPTPLTVLDVVAWLLDKGIKPMITLTLSKGKSLSEFLQQTFHISGINAVVSPLSTRLDRGIAQLSALSETFDPRATTRRLPFQHVRPMAFLSGFVIGLVIIPAMSIGFATLLCCAGLLLTAMGDIGMSWIGGVGVTVVQPTEVLPALENELFAGLLDS